MKMTYLRSRQKKLSVRPTFSPKWVSGRELFLLGPPLPIFTVISQIKIAKSGSKKEKILQRPPVGVWKLFLP